MASAKARVETPAACATGFSLPLQFQEDPEYLVSLASPELLPLSMDHQPLLKRASV